MTRTRLKKLVNSSDSAEPELPLVHTTDLYTLINILEDGEIRTRPCPNFQNEMLLYLFYGRPSYRVNPSIDAIGLDHYLPICAVLKGSNLVDIKRIFPFDSGGFIEDIYSDALHRWMQLEDFILEPSRTTPGKVINLFFDDVGKYMIGRGKENNTFSAMQPEAASYSALINNPLGNSGDNRVSGIEIQIGSNINVPVHIEALIIPSVLADDLEIMAQIKTFGIEPVVYSSMFKMKPSEYQHTIMDACVRYYKQKGIL